MLAVLRFNIAVYSNFFIMQHKPEWCAARSSWAGQPPLPNHDRERLSQAALEQFSAYLLLSEQREPLRLGSSAPGCIRRRAERSKRN
jgi:hypothetical protein